VPDFLKRWQSFFKGCLFNTHKFCILNFLVIITLSEIRNTTERWTNGWNNAEFPPTMIVLEFYQQASLDFFQFSPGDRFLQHKKYNPSGLSHKYRSFKAIFRGGRRTLHLCHSFRNKIRDFHHMMLHKPGVNNKLQTVIVEFTVDLGSGLRCVRPTVLCL
jgi:hypothetical protein